MKILIFLLTILTIPLCAQETIELPLTGADKIVVKLMFRNGSISDPAGKEGLTALTAAMITGGGSQTMSYSDIQEAIYPMAASYEVLVDKEVSVFTFSIHRDFAEQFYPIMRDLMQKPAFEEKDFNRIKQDQQVYVDQVVRASSDEEYSKKALEDFLFHQTNYQHLIEGKSISVASITLMDVKNHYSTYFTRHNLRIGIAGNYSQNFMKRLQNDMQKLPDTKSPGLTPGKARQPNGVEVEIISKENAFGSAIFAGFPLSLTRADENFAALMVANSYLGEHRSIYAKLYQEIREKRSMNYGDYSYIEWYENGGGNMLPVPGVPRSSNYFSIWIRPVQIARQLRQQYEELAHVKVGHAHFALRMAFYELGKLVRNGLTEEDFEATREFLRSYVKLYAQTPEKQLGFLLDSKFYGRENYLKELDGLLAGLTHEDVNKAIRKYWQTDNMFVTIVTDTSEAVALAESLLRNLASPMSYSNLVREGLPREILDDDNAVENLKLNVTSVKIVDSNETFK